MPGITIPNAAELTSLGHVIDGVGTMAVKLFKNDFTPDDNTVVGDFTEADYASYAAQSIGFSAGPLIDADGRAFGITQDFQFPFAGSGSQTVYGWYIVDAAGDLLMCRRYDAPLTITTSVRPDAALAVYRLNRAA